MAVLNRTYYYTKCCCWLQAFINWVQTSRLSVCPSLWMTVTAQIQSPDANPTRKIREPLESEATAKKEVDRKRLKSSSQLVNERSETRSLASITEWMKSKAWLLLQHEAFSGAAVAGRGPPLIALIRRLLTYHFYHARGNCWSKPKKKKKAFGGTLVRPIVRPILRWMNRKSLEFSY
jgi:hypothetical protein